MPPTPLPSPAFGASGDTGQIVADIREANLSYVLLAQHLVRCDREKSLYRLGISETTADLIAALTPAQVGRIACSETLLCGFRMDDERVWDLVVAHARAEAPSPTERLHARLVMVGQPWERG